MIHSKKKIDIEKYKMQAMLIWGKDVPDPEEKAKGVPGIDYPANPGLLKGWG